VYEVDAISLLGRELLRERMPTLVAEACAWSVGLSDRPHHVRRHGRVTATGLTLGMRAGAEQQLGGEEDGRLELADARAGSFGDLLNALTAEGRLYAELLDEQVLTPFVLDTCAQAVRRARAVEPAAYAELLEELDDDGSDPVELVRVAEWEAPLKTEAEQLLLAALAAVPLVEVEAEGLPLSLVRAAEAETRAAAPVVATDSSAPDVSGALFLAEVALQTAALPVPVPPTHASALVAALTAEGIEPDEVLVLLPHLPVLQETAKQVAARFEQELRERP
jgi:hypothetical protein